MSKQCYTVKIIKKLKVIQIHFKLQHILGFHKPSSGNIWYFSRPVFPYQPATQQHTAEHNWQYTYTVGFVKYQMLSEDGL
jgi:hypothetical protein